MSNEIATDDARSRWQNDRTTFQRVYDVVTGITEYVTATEIGERANCSADGARDSLSQLVEMGIVERRGKRPVEYRRNESYFRWKRVETLASEYSVVRLRKQFEDLIDEDQSFQEQFDIPDPDAIAPVIFEDVDHETVHEQWDAITRWRSVREDLEILQRAIQRAEQDTEDNNSSTSAPV